MVSKTDRKMERERRHIRVRTKISGTTERPRLCIYRSNTNLYAQLIDDSKGITIASASTLDKQIKTKYEISLIEGRYLPNEYFSISKGLENEKERG